jgi:hypothetical protein
MASIACPNCQTVAPEGTASCPGCGTPLSGATHAASSTPPPAAPPPSAPTFSAGSPKPQVKFDLASLGHVDRLVGGGTLVLFISLFLTWFSYAGFGISGLSAHGYLYVVFIVAIALLGLLAAEVSGVWKVPASSALGRDQILLIGTTINFVLVLIAFLLKPGGYGFHGVGWSYGAFVALAAAVVAVFPLGWPIIQARRGK